MRLAPLVLFIFVYLVEARMRANTQRTARGHETRGAGVGRRKAKVVGGLLHTFGRYLSNLNQT